jgi:enoyl-CoA hydratase
MVMFAAGNIATDEVLFAEHGGLGRIRLNRPRAINALTQSMVSAMEAQLEDWAVDERIHTVSVEGAGDKGLCAGGDVRAVREGLLAGSADPRSFWEDEYRLNATIAHYPKPFVAFMDGVTMGGGLGISAHGSTRLVTERSRLAMPETAIGFFPDTGMLHLLARAPGELGTHLAMTGQSVGGSEALCCGLADAMIESRHIPRILAKLANGESIDDFTVAAATSPLSKARGWIDECYRGDDTATILARLTEHPEPAAREAAKIMRTRSPQSVVVTLAAIRRAAQLSLDEVLAQDLRLGCALAVKPDFAEGVRALLVDRDNTPQWQHSNVDAVDPATVAAMFD